MIIHRKFKFKQIIINDKTNSKKLWESTNNNKGGGGDIKKQTRTNK